MKPNNIISKYVWGIRFDWYSGCDGNIISGNHISNSTNGIEITGCNDNKILNNTIENNRVEGIDLTDAQYTTVSGNIICYNGEGYEFECGIILVGLLSEDCCYNTVSGNIISNNNPTGIYVNYAFGNVIKENTCRDVQVPYNETEYYTETEPYTDNICDNINMVYKEELSVNKKDC